MNSLKEAFSMQNLLKNLNFFGELNLGLILTAVGIVYFKNPNHFAFGGTSGLSILLADLFPKINVGGFMWIINLVLVVLGFVFLGVKCMGWTIYSSFALSFFVSVCEWLYPSGVSMSGDACWTWCLRCSCPRWVRPSCLTSVHPPAAPTLWP